MPVIQFVPLYALFLCLHGVESSSKCTVARECVAMQDVILLKDGLMLSTSCLSLLFSSEPDIYEKKLYSVKLY